MEPFESPIEEAMYHALEKEARGRGFSPVVYVRRDEIPADYHGDAFFMPDYVILGIKSSRSAHVILQPQTPIDRWYADIFACCSRTGRVLAVECDGHEFHERTKEQAARDRARDRAFQEAGLPVFRFTGSEIHANALHCAKQCLDFLLEPGAPNIESFLAGRR